MLMMRLWHTPRRRSLLSRLLLAGLVLVPTPAATLLAAPSAVAHGGAPAQFPTDPRAAMEADMADLEKWAEGSVSLIILDEEEEIWEGLENDEQRQRFVAWFWARRDSDLRDPAIPALLEFYTRVAAANERFTELPRGWRSDRGRVWVMFGKPTSITIDPDDQNTLWNYFAPGLWKDLAFDNNYGDMNIRFIRVRQTYRIDGDLSPGNWPPYVMRVMESIRQGLVLNPDLEFNGGS